MTLRIPAQLHATQPDPDTRMLLARMAEGGQPPLYEQRVADARLALKAITALFDLPPQPVAAVSDETVPGEDGYNIPVRIYQPASGTAGAPRGALVLLHGGGWALGDLDTHDAMSRYVCAGARRVVVSVDYRLAPEHPFPAAIEDGMSVLRWLPGQSAKYGAAPSGTVVMGDSAGGNLAAVLSQMARSEQGMQIDRQILLYPSVDINESGDYPSRTAFGGGEFFLSLADIRWLRGMYLPQAAAPLDARVSPVHAEDLTDLPDAMIVTAGYDPLRDEGLLYARRLADAGNRVRHSNYPGTIHGFCSFAGALAAGRRALDEVCGWLQT